MIGTLLLMALAAAGDAPQVFALNAVQPVWDVAAEDLNGDGRKEICALTTKSAVSPMDKRLKVFVADAQGAYPADANLDLALDPAAGVLFFAEVDGQAPRELVAAHAEGATVYRFGPDGFSIIAEPRFFCLLPSGSKEPQFFDETAVDLDGDGVDEWLIPVASGYTLMHADGTYVLARCDVVSEVRRGSSVSITHRLPSFRPFSFDGHQNKGIAFLSDSHADFVYGESWKEHRRFTVPGSVEDKWEATTLMADVNGDDFPDLMVTQTKGTVKLESTTHVYVASAPFTYPENPTATFTAKGAVSAPVITDVDGDEKGDILLITVPFGIKNFMNLFLRNMVTAEAQVYLYNGKDFGNAPAYKTSLRLEAPEGREQIAYALGDFNGDGRMDVGLGKGKQLLSIHLGEPKQFLAEKPWIELQIPSFGRAKAHDLNGNAARDIVIHHPGMESSDRVEVVVF